MKLTAKKRNQLLALALGTVLLLGGLYWVLIRREHQHLDQTRGQIADLKEHIDKAAHRLELADRLKEELGAARKKLDEIEDTMAQGDVYRWFVNTMLNFQGSEGVEITNYDPPQTGEVESAAKLAYKAAVFGVRGTARYHEFGAFLAKLENQFPYAKVQNLELEPTSVAETNAEDEEKLAFKMDVVMLIKPSPGIP